MSDLVQVSGELFVAVQQAHIFPDSKTFVDCIPLRDSTAIMQDYLQQRTKIDFDLASFVKANFKPCELAAKDLVLNTERSMSEHINYLWDILARNSDNVEHDSSLLALPKPYIVPGGRFSEIYYWDSYFTAEGLAVSNNFAMIGNMLDNFTHLIDTIGHIPNGNRAYYISRSQPPFFCQMVDILYRHAGIRAIEKYLPYIEKEYYFWISDVRTVQLADGLSLSRYWDNEVTPRPESYREDVELAHEQDNPELFYRNIRAAAESGWDFSSRWFHDGKNLATINTTEILPIDLNAILYSIEDKLSSWLEEVGKYTEAAQYQQRAMQRKEAINRYLWNAEFGFYFDYNFVRQQPTSVWSAAGVYPLFFKLADQMQADLVANNVRHKFLHDGGIVTTLNTTTEQWDAPNGWAPLQWLVVNGLANYGQQDLAQQISHHFIANVQNVFTRTGKMMEKYNVCDLSINATGGEYPLQDGFGWTNGVVLALLERKLLTGVG